MPDGQLQSHPIRVYVNAAITKQMEPKLRLLGSHTLTDAEKDESIPIEAQYAFADQEWAVPLAAGLEGRGAGTLLIFDLKNARLIPWYKAMSRLTPIVEWTETNENSKVERRAIADREVNLGQTGTAWIWTLAIVAALLALIAFLAHPRSGGRDGKPDGPGATAPSQGLRGLLIEDGHFSLARTQIAIWTVATGTMVIFYGLVRLAVPTLPPSVILLMGMSLATGGLRYVAPVHTPPAPDGNPPAPDAPAGGSSAKAHRPVLSDLLCDVDPVTGARTLSIARAQMVFWTVVIAGLFLLKSALEGSLWDVPSEMVALMGISQLGYLAPKFAAGPAKTQPA